MGRAGQDAIELPDIARSGFGGLADDLIDREQERDLSLAHELALLIEEDAAPGPEQALLSLLHRHIRQIGATQTPGLLAATRDAFIVLVRDQLREGNDAGPDDWLRRGLVRMRVLDTRSPLAFISEDGVIHLRREEEQQVGLCGEPLPGEHVFARAGVPLYGFHETAFNVGRCHACQTAAAGVPVSEPVHTLGLFVSEAIPVADEDVIALEERCAANAQRMFSGTATLDQIGFTAFVGLLNGNIQASAKRYLASLAAERMLTMPPTERFARLFDPASVADASASFEDLIALGDAIFAKHGAPNLLNWPDKEELTKTLSHLIDTQEATRLAAVNGTGFSEPEFVAGFVGRHFPSAVTHYASTRRHTAAVGRPVYRYLDKLFPQLTRG